MARSEKRKTKPQQTSTSPPANRPSRTTVPPERPPARGGDCVDADRVAVVRRSSVAPCLTCGLCGGILRDATTVSECLHSFCRKCIYQKFEDEDIKCCPNCYTDLGCAPLEKLRADHGLQHIRSTMFPVKKRKVDEISPLYSALVSQPAPSPGTGGEDYATKATRKTGASLMDEPMNSETGTREKFGTEYPASPPKPNTSSLDRPIMTILRRDEEEEITFKFVLRPLIREPVLATSEKKDSGKQMHRTPSTFLSPSPARSGPPSTNARIFTAMASIPSSKAHDKEVDVEVVKETSTSQGLAHDFSMPREALALDQTDPRQSQAALVTPVLDQVRKKIPTKSASSVPPATTLVATNDISHIQTQFQYDKNLRTELYNICNQNSESLLQRIEAHISQSQVFKDVARLKEELENARSEKIEAFGRVRILEGRLKEQTERLQSESKRSQEIMASQRELLREHEALKSEMAKKDKDLTNLKHDSTMVVMPAVGSSQPMQSWADESLIEDPLLDVEQLARMPEIPQRVGRYMKKLMEQSKEKSELLYKTSEAIKRLGKELEAQKSMNNKLQERLESSTAELRSRNLDMDQKRDQLSKRNKTLSAKNRELEIAMVYKESILTDWKNGVYRLREELSQLKEAHEELKKDHETACKKLQDSDAQLLKSMGTIREMNTAMERKQKEVTELEDAAAIVVNMFYRLTPGVGSRSLLERLRDLPQKIARFVPHVAKFVTASVLGLVKWFYPDAELKLIAEGVPEDCSDEKFAEYLQEMEH